ncbi:hypothetical protein KBTX_03313 [wastewater metagenome]|uniref:Uncharacterized protein n=2 Tax=unclassified sequences TaxID=12908 RepID=A0A5B8RDN8_9ZZZZ|nr:hypothetical protein KBTEX_03313 [uncultured organism]
MSRAGCALSVMVPIRPSPRDRVSSLRLAVLSLSLLPLARASAPATANAPFWPRDSAPRFRPSTDQVAAAPASRAVTQPGRHAAVSPTWARTSVSTLLSANPAPMPTFSLSATAPTALHWPRSWVAPMSTTPALTVVEASTAATTSLATSFTAAEPLPATLLPLPAEGETSNRRLRSLAATSNAGAVTVPLTPIPAVALESWVAMFRPAPTEPPSALFPKSSGPRLPATARRSMALSAWMPTPPSQSCSASVRASVPSTRPDSSQRAVSAPVSSYSRWSTLLQGAGSAALDSSVTPLPTQASASMSVSITEIAPAAARSSASPEARAYWLGRL